MPSPLTRHMAARRQEADDAVEELTAVLHLADPGLLLPSLAVDDRSRCTGTVVVDLGGCRPDVVRAITVLIRRGVECVQRHDH